MNKHPDCEDRCQILEHKGYHDCSQIGYCQFLTADLTRKMKQQWENHTEQWYDEHDPYDLSKAPPLKERAP